MARTHMRWQFGAWDKPDHAETGKDARHLYMVICSDESINQAGVVTMRLGLWAEEAAMDDDDAQAALDELEKRRFVVTDARYAQLLIRSFIRNDEVYKQPNVLRSALSHAKALRSKPIKRVLAEELRKLPPRQPDKLLDNGRTFVYPDPHATAAEIDPDGGDGGEAHPVAEGWVKGSRKGSENPSGGADEEAPDDPSTGLFPEPFSEALVEVEGVVEVEVTPVAPHQNEAPTELAVSGPLDDQGRAIPPLPDPRTASETKRAQVLATTYYDRVKLCSYVAVMKLAKQAIRSEDYTDIQIQRGMLRLAKDRKTVTANNLRVAIEKSDTNDKVAGVLAFLRPEDEDTHYRGTAS